jgi:hypothetical protein
MAQQMSVNLIDDVTGESDKDPNVKVQTVKFGIDGVNYEIDLSDATNERLHESLKDFVAHGRKVSGARAGRGASRSTTTERSEAPDAKTVRAWAASNGHEVPPRGRIPNNVLEAFKAAGN